MTPEPTFSEDDFQIDDQDESTVELDPVKPDTDVKVGTAKAGPRSRKLGIAIGSAVAALAAIGGGIWAIQSEHDVTPAFGDETVEVVPATIASPPLSGQVVDDYSVSYGDQGVEINEVESKIADTLLKSRPTHIEVDQLVNEKLEKLFENPDRLTKLRALNAEDRQAMERNIAVLGENIAALRAGLTDLKSAANELRTSQQNVEARQTRLEEAFARTKKATKPEVAKRVTLEPRLHWEVTAMSNSVAILRNTSTGEKLRVAVGHSISGCGQVKDFDVANNIVRTSTGCVIQRRKG